MIYVNEIIAKSEAIVLRPTEPKDLEFVCTAEQAEVNRDFVSQQTLEQHTGMLANKDMFHLIVESASRPVGYVLMSGLTSPNRCIEVKRIVITEKGQGFGREALKLCKVIAFDMKNAHRLWLDVVEHNQRARNLYLSEGFIEEGILRECDFYQGMFQSMVIMSVLENEYRASVDA